MSYTIRPISKPTRFTGAPGIPDRFQADLNDTKRLLEYEVDRLDGYDLVVELDVLPGDISVTGTALKAYARPAMPGVVVAFGSKHGPLVYASERFNDWRANLRAVAKSLEALRAVDRYGVSGHGEQYTGWAQIEAAPSSAVRAAEQILGITAGDHTPEALKAALRRARAAAHPDLNDGDQTLWDQVEQAARVLGVLS